MNLTKKLKYTVQVYSFLMGVSFRNRDILKNISLCKENRKNPILAEVKVYSPKYGDLLKGRNAQDILSAYEDAGAIGISYITETEHFKGNIEMLKTICRETELPVLRKDFILSRDEVEKTAEAEASIILLIARMLNEKTAEFVDYSIEHGLQPLVEVHNQSDIELTLNTKTKLIGINNRDISKLEIDDGNVSLTERLSRFIPNDRIIVSESGISTLEDLKRALSLADAVLIGTAFMQAENTEEFVRSFVEAELC
jgi:indole-3-glycerol phosphate synthase